MMRRLPKICLSAALTLLALAHRAEAQGSASASAPPLPPSDSIFRRARRLVSEGQGATGRALVDSLLRAAPEGTPSYGDALFWRGALAETAADAERDYRRVIVEYPLSPYSDDALLSLAELEQARGDRAAAYQHLQRFVHEHPASPARARAGLAAARLAFEQHDASHGCAMIADARASVGSSDIELRNQIEYYGGHCPTATAAAAATTTTTTTSATTTASPRAGVNPPPSTANVTPAGASRAAPAPAGPATPATRAAGSAMTAAAKTAPAIAPPTKADAPPPAVSRGIWTIQLAAYNTRGDAERLVSKLAARGVNARISGDAKPFRVRLDYYATRQAAAAEVVALKQRGIIGFVTDEPRTTGAPRP